MKLQRQLSTAVDITALDLAPRSLLQFQELPSSNSCSGQNLQAALGQRDITGQCEACCQELVSSFLQQLVGISSHSALGEPKPWCKQVQLAAGCSQTIRGRFETSRELRSRSVQKSRSCCACCVPMADDEESQSQRCKDANIQALLANK